MMKPIDTFYYIKHNQVQVNVGSLIQLYFPIIGGDAFALYHYFTQFFDNGSRSHKLTEVLNHLQFGMPRLEEALSLLTALDLLSLYQISDHYLIKINPPLDKDTFLSNPVYKSLLEKEIGELAVSDMMMTVPYEAREMSKSFSEVFGSKITTSEAMTKVKANVPKIHFDLDSFKNLMIRDGLQFEDEKSDIVQLYSLMEQYKMTWFDLYQLAKETAINGKIAPSRLLVKKQESQHISVDIAQFTAAEQIILKEAKNDTALIFLEKIKNARHARVTKDERELLISLAKMNFLDEVINVMVLYTFNKTKSANLQKNYLLKIANDFSYQRVTRAEDAILKMRTFEERKLQSTASTKKVTKSNVPAWSNPDYKESTSPEQQAELDRFKEEALKRLENLSKGGE
ncbi:DnaD domain protein [Streptococcus uberis]|nr:DnaD domain protein [Streptococcus uberis]MCK1256059.1 DnaD domain protein [Streptococcus uberis]